MKFKYAKQKQEQNDMLNLCYQTAQITSVS